ncbi:MAG: hypothetical protein ACHQFZ_09305 [Acidimicrobiales bacterium]
MDDRRSRAATRKNREVDMATWSGRRGQWATRTLAVALGMAAFVQIGIGPSGASSKGAAVFTFKITGVGNGTLHAGPIALCANTDVKHIGLTGVDGMIGSVSGFPKGASSWGLQIEEKKTGTFKITGSYTNDPTVELRPTMSGVTGMATAIKWTFWAKSGTVTLAAESGTISASMSNQSGQKIKITGSWKCPVF